MSEARQTPRHGSYTSKAPAYQGPARKTVGPLAILSLICYIFNMRKPKHDWRAFLTPEEKAEIAQADTLKAEWQKANRARAMITNRAIQRTRYHERTRK